MLETQKLVEFSENSWETEKGEGKWMLYQSLLNYWEITLVRENSPV